MLLLTLIVGQTPAAASMLAAKPPTRTAIPSATRAPTRTPTLRPTRTPTITPTPSSTPLPPKGQLYDIKWAPDSKALYVYSSAGLWRYSADLWNKPVVSVPATAFPKQSASPGVAMYAISNELVATVAADRIIRFWDPRDGQLRNKLRALGADVNALAFSPDGSLLVASTRAPEGAIHIWDLNTNLEMATLIGAESTNGDYDQDPNLTFTADSQTLIYKTRDGEIVEWLRVANLVRSTAQHGDFIASHDGFMLAITSEIGNSGNNAVGVFDVRANALLRTLKDADKPFTVLTFSPDDHALYALNDTRFWRWSLADGKQSIAIHLVDVRDYEAGLYYNPVRNFLARVSQFGHLSDADPFLEVRLQNLISGSGFQLLAHVTAWGEQQGTPVAFSPDGAMLAVAGHNGVQIWDVDSGQTVALLVGFADQLN